MDEQASFVTKVIDSLSAENNDYATAENFIIALVNGVEFRIFRGWLIGGGRGAGSGFARQMMVVDGQHVVTCKIQLDVKLARVFGIMLVWLALGRDVLLKFAWAKCSQDLYALASFFELNRLADEVRQTMPRWETPEAISTGSEGVVVDSQVAYFGCIEDLRTGERRSFPYKAIVQSDSSSIIFGPGERCLFDIKKLPPRGTKPSTERVYNVRPSGAAAFRHMETGPIMCQLFEPTYVLTSGALCGYDGTRRSHVQ